MTAWAGMLTGDRIYRVHWVPGTDTLRGICHCGAEHAAEEPVEMWDWLLAHPHGHQTPGAVPPVPHPPSRLEVPV